MTLKNFKLQIIFSGLLFLFSINLHGQHLRNHVTSAEINCGILQQKLNIGYSYDFVNYTGILSKDRMNQLFLGFDLGTVKLRYDFFEGTGMFGADFVMRAKGYHCDFSITNYSIRPKRRKKNDFKYNYMALKCGINQFYEVHSHHNYYTNNGFSYSEGVYNPKCRSVDLELKFGKLIKLNSYNFINVGLYAGHRFGNTTGISYFHGNLDPNSKGFNKPLKPLILGINLGYQFNFGQ